LEIQSWKYRVENIGLEIQGWKSRIGNEGWKSELEIQGWKYRAGNTGLEIRVKKTVSFFKKNQPSGFYWV